MDATNVHSRAKNVRCPKDIYLMAEGVLGQAHTQAHTGAQSHTHTHKGARRRTQAHTQAHTRRHTPAHTQTHTQAHIDGQLVVFTVGCHGRFLFFVWLARHIETRRLERCGLPGLLAHDLNHFLSARFDLWVYNANVNI